MKRSLIFSIVFFSFSRLLVAAPTVDAGIHYMLPGTSRNIAVMVSGTPSDQVEGLDLYLQIGEGGPGNLSPDVGPTFIGQLDVIGLDTIFGPNNDGAVSGQVGNRIRSAITYTASGTVQAQGTLARIQVNTTGADVGQWALKLSNVANKVFPPNGKKTDFADETIIPVLQDGELRVWNLHTLTWSKNADGNWYETGSWTANPGGYPAHSPNVTVDAVINTDHQVTLDGNQEANSLALSGGGKVSISSTGIFAITTNVTVSTGSMFTIAPSAGLSATGIQLNGGTISGSGTLTPAVLVNDGMLSTPNSSDNLILSSEISGTGGLTKTGSGTVTFLDNAAYAGTTTITDGCLQFDGTNSTLHAITGDGDLSVGNGTTPSILTADSIIISKLTIAAGSKLVLAPRTGVGPTAGRSLTTVPEPSMITLFIMSCFGLFFRIFQKRSGSRASGFETLSSPN